MSRDPVVDVILHGMTFIPLIAVVFCWKTLPREFRLIAAAFAVSWLGDVMAWTWGGSWAWAYLWSPVQLGAVLCAYLPTAMDRVSALAALVMLSGVSFIASGGGPDILLTVGGSAIILMVASGALAWPLRIYFGLGTLFYVPMTLSVPHSPMFWDAWHGYQFFRALAYGVFVVSVVSTHLCPRRFRDVHAAN